MGSAAYHRGYHIVERDLELITAKKADGSPWKKEQNILNGAMGQFNPSNTSEIFSMHVRLCDPSKSGIVLTKSYSYTPRKSICRQRS
jgi:hypothetical protein